MQFHDFVGGGHEFTQQAAAACNRNCVPLRLCDVGLGARKVRKNKEIAQGHIVGLVHQTTEQFVYGQAGARSGHRVGQVCAFDVVDVRAVIKFFQLFSRANKHLGAQRVFGKEGRSQELVILQLVTLQLVGLKRIGLLRLLVLVRCGIGTPMAWSIGVILFLSHHLFQRASAQLLQPQPASGQAVNLST